VSRAAIEERLDAILRSRGEAGLQAVREAARALAPNLGAERAFEALNQMIAATLGSRPAHHARSQVLGARMRGAPYDPGAITRIDQLVVELSTGVFPERHDTVRAGKAWDLIAFFDAYRRSSRMSCNVSTVPSRRSSGGPKPARPRDIHGSRAAGATIP
jgi:hypothetical protein